MEKIPLEIIGLSNSVSHTNSYAVILGELDGKRRLPIVIGGFEAQAIAVAMEGMMPTRPLTHDLFKSTLDNFNIQIKEVVINNLLDGVFHARLICDFNGEIAEVDSRTSDAIAMAVRFDCPVYTYEFILEAAGLESDDSAEGPEDSKPKRRRSRPKKVTMPFSEQTHNQLNELLAKVIGEEDYEKAALIRDELNKRKGKQQDS
jgi:bifunctional DNase/RNase